jgi:outer membrane protein assembly factor BamB
MRNALRIIPLLVAVLAVAAFATWVTTPPPDVEIRLPKPDKPIVGPKIKGPPPNTQGILVRSDVGPAEGYDGMWHRFRGPDGDAISEDPTELIETFPSGGPKKLWSMPVGDGHAGAAIRDGAVYLLDYDAREEATLREDDIRPGKLAAFCRVIYEGTRRDTPSPARRIWTMLDESTRATVETLATAETPEVTDAAREAIRQAVNRVILSDELYTRDAFQQVELGREGERLLKNRKERGLASFKEQRLNRLLIDATFPRDVLLPAWEGDVVRKLNLETGEEIWRYVYELPVKQNHGMSRTVPYVTDRYVVTSGPKCNVTVLDVETGELQWGLDMVRKYGTTVPDWWAGQSPLVDGNNVIIAPSGPEVLMAAIDIATGETVWEVPNEDGGVMSHATPVIMEYGGKRFYVAITARNSAGTVPGGVYGVSSDGELLWGTTAWSVSTAAPSALPLSQGRIALCAGYDAGGMLLQLVPRQEGRWEANVLETFKSEEFSSEQQTPIFHEGHVFTILPKVQAGVSQQLMCMTPAGRRLWTSGRENRFGWGSYVFADGRLWIMGDRGTLSMVIATPERFSMISEARVLGRAHDSWGPIAIADGLMVVRDVDTMSCLDLRKAE